MIQKARDGKAWDTLMELADKLSPKIRTSFIRAATAARSSLDTKELIRLLESGQYAAAEEAVADAAAYQGVVPTLQTALLQAATQELATANAILGVTMHMDQYNPLVIAESRKYTGDLITQITDDQLFGVRATVTTALQRGTPIPSLARDLRQMVGLTSQQRTWVLNYREQLENSDLNALSRQLRDARSDGKILRLFQSGEKLSPSDIDKLVERYSNSQLMYRAENIARTESINALSAGNRLAWKQAVADGHATNVYSRWFTAPDERTCVLCKPIPSMNPDGVPLGTPFNTPVGQLLGPIVHPQCRCVVFSRPR